MTVVSRAGIAGPGGVSLTNNTVNTMLNRLLSLGLLKADFSCVESLRHPLAVEMIAAPEGRKVAEAIRRIFPATPSRPYYYSYSLQSDPGARVRLRLAIYENDGDAYRRMFGEYDKVYSRALGPHILEELFAETILDVSWLASRDFDIQVGCSGSSSNAFYKPDKRQRTCQPFWRITANARKRLIMLYSNGSYCASIFWRAGSPPPGGK